jgi:hypothetical protein
MAVVLAVTGCGTGGDPSGNGNGGGTRPPPTWYQEVQPVLARHCLACHADGGLAFSLERYEDAAPLSGPIAETVATGQMPPWPPDETDCEPLADSRTLPAQDVTLLGRWFDADAPLGTPVTETAPPVVPNLPRVDRELDLGVDYVPATAGTDEYRCFILDHGLEDDTDLIGVEVVPGSSMVHHALVFQADPDRAAEAEAHDPEPGWRCFGGPGTGATATDVPDVVAAWAPGTPPTVYPEGTGIPLRSHRVLVIQIHYSLVGGIVPDRTAIRLMLAEERVGRPARLMPIYWLGLVIPPFTGDYGGSSSHNVIAPGRLYGVIPHMHRLGRRIRVDRVRGSERRCVVDIPRWDFHWQQIYFFADAAGMDLEVLDELRIECAFDNPTEETVRWGDGTDDEMCLAYLYVVDGH